MVQTDLGVNDNVIVEEGKIIKYNTRWLQLCLFCAISMSNAMLWITFSPISTIAVTFYDVEPLTVNCRMIWLFISLFILVFSYSNSFLIQALSLIYMLMYIPMVFPAGLYLDKAIPVIPGGLRWGLTVGIVGSALSVCIFILFYFIYNKF